MHHLVHQTAAAAGQQSMPNTLIDLINIKNDEQFRPNLFFSIYYRSPVWLE
jgi:hypothetical protein